MTGDTEFRTRMAKLLEMLRSPFDGEVMNAVRKANIEMAKRKMTYTELVMKALPAPARDHYPYGQSTRRREDGKRPQSRQTQQDLQYRSRAALMRISAHFRQLVQRDQDFIKGMADWRGSYSEKQRKYIDDVMEKLKCKAAQAQARKAA
jgi:hypothetical protein